MADQLTSYLLAEPSAERAAFCVLVRTKTPRIEWQFATRSGEAHAEFLKKASIVVDEIAARRFYKRPGMWCRWCDYLPVCLGDEKQAKEQLLFSN